MVLASASRSWSFLSMARLARVDIEDQCESVGLQRTRRLDRLDDINLEGVAGNVVRALKKETTHRQPQGLKKPRRLGPVVYHFGELDGRDAVDEPNAQSLYF